MVLHLTSCCCGCSLKTGSVTVAILGAIVNMGTLVACIVLASGANQIREASSNNFLPPVLSPISSAYDEMNPMNVGEITNAVSTGAEVFFIVYAIISAVQLILNIMLIFGASAEKPHLVKPWVIMGVITAGITGIVNVVQIIMAFVAAAFMTGSILLVVYAVTMCIIVYFILVVNSFHTELISQHGSRNNTYDG